MVEAVAPQPKATRSRSEDGADILSPWSSCLNRDETGGCSPGRRVGIPAHSHRLPLEKVLYFSMNRVVRARDGSPSSEPLKASALAIVEIFEIREIAERTERNEIASCS